MEIKGADAELVDARDLKSPGATEITHLSDLTHAGNVHKAGGDPAVLSNIPPARMADLPAQSRLRYCRHGLFRCSNYRI